MIPILHEKKVFSLKIGNIYEEGNGLILHSPTPISRILIEIIWKTEVQSAFIPVIRYCDILGNTRDIHYNLDTYSFISSVRLYNVREPINDAFESSYLSFQLNDTGIKTENVNKFISFEATVYRLEDTDREWIVANDES